MFGQNVDMDKLVTLNYTNVRIGDAIQNISTKYQVYFTYSKHHVPVNQRVDMEVYQVPLWETLDALFYETDVVYMNVGDQIILKKGKKPNRKKEEPLFSEVKPPMRAIEREEEPVFTASNRPYEEVEEVPLLEAYKYSLPEVLSEQPEEELDTERYYVEAPERDYSQTTAQVSIVPAFGTNMDEAENRTNNFSLNVLGGENGGVDGVEIGGFFNKVKNDVNGVQIAGLFNAVGGDVGPSKIIDGEHRKTFGIQIAGLVNTADNVRAVQIAGLTNLNGGDFQGVQIAGLGSWNGADGYGAQVSGLFNINRGDTNVQVAGITNISRDVEGTQVSGLFNRARNVDGVQFALINVCDTISGASIGLLNFVRRGYNQIEIGGSETLYGQFAFRFGSRRFYNIFQFGSQFGGTNIYSLGYGIGTTLRNFKNEKWQWNFEGVLSQISENDRWFKELNVIGELRLTAEFKISNRASFYLGPTFNVMISDLFVVEEGETIYGSTIPQYTIHDNNNSDLEPRDLKAWIGFRAGLRFGRN